MTYFSCTRPASDGTLSSAGDYRACQEGVRSLLRSVATNERRSSRGRRNIRLRIETSFGRRLSSWRPTAFATTSSAHDSVSSVKSSANGGSGSSTNAWPAWTKNHEAGGQPASSLRSSASRARVPALPASRWRAGRCGSCNARSSRAAWLRPSAARPSGAGSRPMRSGPGAVAVGCSRAIPTLP
jgi:hypothetical protein